MIPMFTQAARVAAFQNFLTAMGNAAPAAGTPLHAMLERQLGACMEAARADHRRFLSLVTREALLSGLSAHRARDPQDFIDSAVRDGFDGYALSPDWELVSVCSSVSIRMILEGAEPAHELTILSDLSGPEAAEIVCGGEFDSRDPDAGLFATLEAKLRERGLPNPFDWLDATESESESESECGAAHAMAGPHE